LRPADKRHRITFDLEFFWTDQCVEEVEAEPDGDDQSDDRFTHLEPLKLTQGVRVEAHERQKHQPEDHECHVEHDRLLAGRSLAPTAISIRLRIALLLVRIS
jgi:hypothetical protein